MVDLWFNLKKWYGLSNADDVRSVVKNATKDVNMSESKDKTIMTSDELREKKAKEIINDKKSKIVPTAKTQNQTVNNKSSINVNTNKIWWDILNKNVMVWGIDNIKPETIKNNEWQIVKESGIKVNNIWNDFGGGIEWITKDLSGIWGTTISPEQMNKKKEEINQRRELTKEAMNYVWEFANSVNDSILNGEEDRLTIENIRKAFPEFNSLDDKQLGDLTRDIYNANKLWNEFNLYNYALKHPELYMEFDNSEQIGNVGRADYLDAMFNSSDASSKPWLFKIMTLGLAPNELGILDTTTLDETDIGDEWKTFMNNAWKSVWNAVALTYNFLNHPLESVEMLGWSILWMWADYALKKQAEKEWISKDEFVQWLINNMWDGSSFSDKITKLLVNWWEMWSLMKDFFKTNYGSAEWFLNYLYTDPAGAISDIVSIWELWVWLAGKMWLIEKSAVKSINKTLWWIDPYEATWRALLWYENVPWALWVATRAEWKVLRGVTKWIRKASGNVVDFVLNKMTGIGEEQRKFIKENPDLAMKYIKGEETAQDIVERIMNKFNELWDEKKAEWERYNLIRNNGNLSVKIWDAINNIKDVFGELWIKISNWKLQFKDISYSDAQKRALQNVYKYVDSLSKRWEDASVSDVWRVRQLIDNAINWEWNSKMWLDAEVMNTIKNMRNKVDDALKSQVEWFKDIDNNYSRIINAIKELKKDWFNKDWSLKDNALSKIRNLTNKGNEKKLERLEKYLPWIWEDARALWVAEVIDKATKQNVGQYLQQWLVWGWLVWLWALMTWWVSTAGVITALWMMWVLTPKNFVKVLATMWKVWEKVSNSAVWKWAKMVWLWVDWIKSVWEKIIKWEKLSQSQIDAIEKLTSENMRDFMANPEKYVDYEYDRAQKSAYLGHESTEKKLLEEEIKKLDKKYEKKMKDIWFVRDVEDWILKDSEWYSLLKEKLYNWRKDAGDTTRQHEFFHSVFSVVDDKTYRYVLDEAKKYLNLDENKLGSKADEVADEWLAESFGVYIRRKEIKSGEIRLKGNRLERFNSKIKDLFQRAYEWIQGYIVDRETIDKLFDEVYGWVKLNDAGKVDLAEKLGINNKKLGWVENNKWLRYKKGWHGGWDFDEFDLSHSREWEWGEAHGYGVYVTENKERAKAYGNLYRNNKYGYYRDFSDAKQFVSYKGMKKPEIDWKYAYLVRKVIDGMMENDEAYPYYDAESQIAKQKRAINNEKNVMMGRMSWEEFNNYKKEKDAELKFLDSLDPKDFKIDNTKRNLYEVDVPNKVKRETPTWSNYLEEKGEIPMLAIDDFAFAIDEKLGNEAYKWFLKELWRKRNLLWEDIYRALSNVLGSTKEASMFLKDLGYDGIHYIGELDGSSYVLFNDKGLPIKDKIRYKKIWNKEVAINTKATSPSQLSEVNADGLSVMKAFISDKQAEKALWVNKALLDKDGNAYMWTHTNKYSDNVITDFKSTKDSKYKSFEGTDIAWFTNNENMSKSYANWESRLANTKKVNSLDELNKFLDDNKHEYVVNTKVGTMTSYSRRHVIKTDEWYELIRETSDVTKQPIEAYYQDYNGMWEWYDLWEMPKDKNEALKKLQDYLDEHDYQVTGTRKVKLLDDWNVEMTHKYEPSIYGIYDTLDQALKEWAGRWMPAGKYHYQWIIQDVKNPLVIEVKNQDGTKTYWSRLGTVDDIFKREWIDYNKNVDYYIRDVEEAMDGFSERMKAIEEYWNNAYRDDPYNWISQFLWNVELAANNGVSYMVDEVRNLLKDGLLDENTKRWLKDKVFWDVAQYGETLEDVINELVDFIDTDRNYMALNMLSEDWIKKWIKNMWVSDALQAVMSDKYWTDMLREWRDVWDKWWRENIRWQLTTNWMYLETNDWVKYALRKWDYDGVIFKNIYDYGGKAENMEKWWDVLAAFHSNQFKSWNNEAPTESKYIMYKKNIWLNKKEWKWLSRKDAEYEKAVKGWDMWKAMWLLRKEAESKWYNSSSDYQWSKAFNGSAPRSEWLTKEERVNWWDIYAQTLWDYASDWLDMWNLDWQLNDGLQLALRRRDEYNIESIRNLKKAVDEYRNWNKNAKIKMYRAIDGNIKEEWFRNWDWITPSRKYAEMHIGLQDWDKWKIIEEEVPIENIWWDNNDINEWWYDDGREYGYKNTKNNKKLLEPTYDDNGKLIPLSKRFDEKKSDIRYKKWLERKPQYNWLQEKYNSLPHESKTKIWNSISKMRNTLNKAWISTKNYTKDWPIKNALRSIIDMNKDKDKLRLTQWYNTMIQAREEWIMWIIDAIDKWYNAENMSYKWYYDPISWGKKRKSKNRPTVIIWEWNFDTALKTYKDFRDWIIAEPDVKMWAQHMDINNNTRRSINKFRNKNWKLEISPIRWK